MGFFRGVFGPSKDEVWKELSQQIGADFIDGGFWRGDKVQVHVKNWTITLDTFTVSAGKSQHVFTRVRAPFCGDGAFRFNIYRKGLLSGLGKFFGMMDIESGQSAQFDEDFIIQSNDESKVRSLLGDPEIRRLFEAQPEFHLELKDDDGTIFHHFPQGVDEVIFYVHGVLKDVERLKLLFDLFAAVLDRLVVLGVASEKTPELSL